MSQRQCLHTTRKALYRVFVSPLERPDPARKQLSSLLAQTRSRPGSSGPLLAASTPHVRCFSQSNSLGRLKRARVPRKNTELDVPIDDEDKTYDPRYTTKESLLKSGRDRMPRDLEIKDPKVMVLENDVLEGPIMTRYVLDKLTPEESLRMIQPYVPAKEDKPTVYAICKIVDKKKEYEKEKEKKDKEKKNNGGGGAAGAPSGKGKTKEMELSWGIGDNDMATKMRQMDGFLKKGMRVDLVLGKKRRGKKATEEDVKALVAKVREEIEQCGGKEWKRAEGEPGETYRLFAEKK